MAATNTLSLDEFLKLSEIILNPSVLEMELDLSTPPSSSDVDMDIPPTDPLAAFPHLASDLGALTSWPDTCPIPGCGFTSLCHNRYMFPGPGRKLFQLLPGPTGEMTASEVCTWRDCPLFSHLLTHPAGPSHSCPVCARPHGSRDLLRQHIPSHLPKHKHLHYRCLLCAGEGRGQQGSKIRENAGRHLKDSHAGVWREWSEGRVGAEVEGLMELGRE
jgi:hypothetical protein